MMFQEQVTAIGHWFVEWTEPEQMVLLYSLLKRLTPLQVKLLSRVVDQHVTDCAELQVLEHQANNPAIIGNLLSKRREVAMQQLLLLLPLLRPGNNEAKSRYLSVIPAVLSHSVETGEHLSEAKQLISYSLIHPALLTEDRKQLTPWVQVLKARFNTASNVPVLPLADSILNQQQQQQQQQWRQQKDGTRVRRSNSLTPPVSLCQSSVELWTGQEELCGKQKPRSFSLSEHVPPLSPQSSQASSGSGSETQLDESKTFSSEQPGMRDVGSWLKQLRLHKYIWLFSHLTYDDMLSLTEEKLETLGVTKGARHKIILSIRKLRDRQLTLCQLEKDVNRGGNLMTVLEELKAIVCSPIKPTCPISVSSTAPSTCTTPNTNTNETANKTDLQTEDIPAQLTKVLGKVCTYLIVNNGREEEPLRLSLWLLDRCLSHEAFIPYRRRFETLKLQTQGLLQQHNQRQNRWFHHSAAVAHHHIADTRSLRRPASSYPSRPTYLLAAPQHSLGYEVPNGSAPSLSAGYHPQSMDTTNGSAPSLSSGYHEATSGSAQSLTAGYHSGPLDGKNGSAPSLTPNYLSGGLDHPNGSSSSLAATTNGAGAGTFSVSPSQASVRPLNAAELTEKSGHETDINSTLEDLCLSMAEHFLEGVS